MVLYDSKAPGVYIQELSGGARPIQAVGTSTAGFLGVVPKEDAPVLQPIPINNWTEFIKAFGAKASNGTNGNKQPPVPNPLACAVYGFFQNCGTRCYVINLGNQCLDSKGEVIPENRLAMLEKGLAELERIDEIAIVAAPGCTEFAEYDALINHCQNLKDRVAILDAPKDVTDLDKLKTAGESASPPFTISKDGTYKDKPDGVTAKPEDKILVLTGTGSPGKKVKLLDAGKNKLCEGQVNTDGIWELKIPLPPEKDESFTLVQDTDGVKPRLSAYATFYYPWILTSDPLHPDAKQYTAPSGHIAGIWARSDANRGVHKAPANEPINGALGVQVRLTDDEQGGLNQVGVNCIRFFAREGVVVWGARTLAPDSEWRYLSVRRLFNMIEESIQESTRWIVFEPNDETLWKAIRRDVTAFLTRIWRTGALMGSTPDQAFFVKCDAETNPPEEIDAGKVTIVIGIAPVKPAEFVVFEIGQLEAGSQVTEK